MCGYPDYGFMMIERLDPNVCAVYTEDEYRCRGKFLRIVI